MRVNTHVIGALVGYFLLKRFLAGDNLAFEDVWETRHCDPNSGLGVGVLGGGMLRERGRKVRQNNVLVGLYVFMNRVG